MVLLIVLKMERNTCLTNGKTLTGWPLVGSWGSASPGGDARASVEDTEGCCTSCTTVVVLLDLNHMPHERAAPGEAEK